MEKIVMTLLVRRDPPKGIPPGYAVQITFPRELTPGHLTSLTSVRFVNNKGEIDHAESMDSYAPEEWRAAALWEQAEYEAECVGIIQPWFCVLNSLSKSVYDFPGSGDKDSNNGQVWAEINILGKHERAERRLQQKCEEEMDAEWDNLFGKDGRQSRTNQVREPGISLSKRAQ